MPDVPDVTGPRGPSLDDVLDVLSRTNRGLLAVENTLLGLRDLLLFAIVFLGAMLFGLRTRLRTGG